MVSKYNSILIVIPVHNEEKIIKKTVSEVIREISSFRNQILVLLVNDGSTDGTSFVISNLINHYPKYIKSQTHQGNLGYGAAIKTGIKYAIRNKIDYILFMDSDLTNNPSDIKKFINQIDSDFDCIKASRYIKGGKISNVPLKKVAISRIGNFLASLMFNVGIKDCTNGFRMIKTNMLKNIKLSEKDFSVIMEEMYILKKRHAKFKEIPVTLNNRKVGKSHFNYSPSTFYSYIKYPIKCLWL